MIQLWRKFWIVLTSIENRHGNVRWKRFHSPSQFHLRKCFVHVEMFANHRTEMNGVAQQMFLKEKKSKRPLLVACDVYRPAAVDQLSVLAEQIGVHIYKEPESKNPVQIALNAIQ